MDDRISRLDHDDARYLALDSIPLSLVLTNPNLEDNPIIYVNRTFETVTGYSQVSSVGRNCRFLQGEKTDPATIRELSEKVRAGQDATVDILNYRADGTPFWNRLHVTPLKDHDGTLRYFMGVQRRLGDRRESSYAGSEDEPLREMTHRVKNHLAMVVSLIRMQSRAPVSDPKEDYTSLARRVESLQLLYQEMSDGKPGGDQGRVALGAYVSRVAAAIAHIGSGSGIRTNTEIDAVEAPSEVAAQLGLVLSEILTNAYQHAFAGREEGLVEVRLKQDGDHVELTVRDDGNGIPADRSWPESGSLGGRIARSLISGLHGELHVDGTGGGTLIRLRVPLERS